MSSLTHSRSALRCRLMASSAPALTTTTSADLSLRQSRRAFTHKARSPQVRTHTFTAQPPHLRHLALVTKASRFLARSPCLVAPSMRFLFIGSRFTLYASSPRSVALTQLRFTSLTVTSSWRDLRPQVCAHAGRTKERPGACRPGLCWVRRKPLMRSRPWPSPRTPRSGRSSCSGRCRPRLCSGCPWPAGTRPRWAVCPAWRRWR